MDGRRRALIVATDEYEHPGLQRLLSPAADAAALAEVLGDPQIGDFEVEVVHNEPAHITHERIEELFAEGRPDDVLLLHLSCHGLKNDGGELFFAARNTRPDRLVSTAVSADSVQRVLRSSRSRSIVLLLDCCYGGAFSRGVTVRASGDAHVLDSFPGESLDRGRGRAVITASSAMEYAFEGDQLADDHRAQPSVFTSALINGLATGEADLDEDGWVSLGELYEYVFDQVRTRTPHQTPSRDIQMAGELYVARSRRRRIRPHPLPLDLQAAITSSDPYARRGAVDELRARLASDDLSVAAGAYERLTDTARTDSRFVAELADAALRDAAIHVLEPDLDFGKVAQGSVSPRRTVQLQGPPLARVTTVETAPNWIRIDERSEVLELTVDTSSLGQLHGDITLKGPTGEATISVQVEVTLPPSVEQDRQVTPPPPVEHDRHGRGEATISVPPEIAARGEEPPEIPDRTELRRRLRALDGTERGAINGAVTLGRAVDAPEHAPLAVAIARRSQHRTRRYGWIPLAVFLTTAVVAAIEGEAVGWSVLYGALWLLLASVFFLLARRAEMRNLEIMDSRPNPGEK